MRQKNKSFCLLMQKNGGCMEYLKCKLNIRKDKMLGLKLMLHKCKEIRRWGNFCWGRWSVKQMSHESWLARAEDKCFSSLDTAGSVSTIWGLQPKRTKEYELSCQDFWGQKWAVKIGWCIVKLSGKESRCWRVKEALTRRFSYRDSVMVHNARFIGKANHVVA